MIVPKISKIKNAIESYDKLVIEENNEIRIVQPFCLYSVIDKDTNKTKIMLNCLQEIGDSKSNNTQGWKNIVITNNTKIVRLREKFIIPDGYKYSTERFKHIISFIKKPTISTTES
jgi:hypothetical protein